MPTPKPSFFLGGGGVERESLKVTSISFTKPMFLLPWINLGESEKYFVSKCFAVYCVRVVIEQFRVILLSCIDKLKRILNE